MMRFELIVFFLLLFKAVVDGGFLELLYMK